MKVAILIPTYSQLRLLQRCVSSIVRWTDKVDYEICVIDNSKDKYALNALKAIPNNTIEMTVLQPEENLGWIGGINAGIEFTKGHLDITHFLFLNDDTMILDWDKDWLEKLMVHFLFMKNGAVGPMSNNTMGLQHMNYISNERQIKTTALSGFCMLVKREVIESVGLLDVGLKEIGGDDLDYSTRIRKHGWELRVIRNVFVYHDGCVSYGEAWGDYYNSPEMREDHFQYLIRKHGLKEFLKTINFRVKG